MKKTILLGAILLAGVVSGFPFRTSCGTVVNVTQTEGYAMTLKSVVFSLKKQEIEQKITIQLNYAFTKKNISQRCFF